MEKDKEAEKTEDKKSGEIDPNISIFIGLVALCIALFSIIFSIISSSNDADQAGINTNIECWESGGGEIVRCYDPINNVFCYLSDSGIFCVDNGTPALSQDR